MDITIQNDQVVFTHTTQKGAKDSFTVKFHRTFRVPEQGGVYSLPPSCGVFPVKRVDDYKDKVPASWLEHGGVFIPMYQREALWLSFKSPRRPMAVKVAAGKVNAVSGKPWDPELAPSHGDLNDPRQDYFVTPGQPWLDGFNTGEGTIAQFVAMPLGLGYTVEGQVTGEEKFGGLQIMALPPKEGLLEPKPHNVSIRPAAADGDDDVVVGNYRSAEIQMISESEARLKRPGMYKDLPKAAEMGLAKGGQIEQKIYSDPHGLDTWDTAASGRVFVHLVNSEMYHQITGEEPPTTPITAQTAAANGYPWFALWDQERIGVGGSATLQGTKTVGQIDVQHGFVGQQNDTPVPKTKPLLVGKTVSDGKW